MKNKILIFLLGLLCSLSITIAQQSYQPAYPNYSMELLKVGNNTPTGNLWTYDGSNIPIYTIGKISNTPSYKHAFYQWNISNSNIPSVAIIDSIVVSFDAQFINLSSSEVNYFNCLLDLNDPSLNKNTLWNYSDTALSTPIGSGSINTPPSNYVIQKHKFTSGSTFVNSFINSIGQNNRFTLGIAWKYESSNAGNVSWNISPASIKVYYHLPNQTVIVDQKLSNNSSVDSVGLWNLTLNKFDNYSVPKTFTWNVNDTKTLQGSQKVLSNQKYNYWFINDVNTSDAVNHKSFTITPTTDDLLSQFNPTNSGIKIKNSLEGTTLDGGQIKIKDPWLIDFPDPLYGNTLRNQGMSAPFREQTSPFSPDYTSSYNGYVYKGLFLNQSGPGSNWQGTYYSVGSPSEQIISVNNQNRKFYPFKWGGTGVTIQNEYLPETGIVFNTSNAVAVASLKGQLMSNSTTGISSNSQRKMVRTDNGIYHVVYESFGHVFYTHSLTSDFSGAWAADQLVLDHAKNPAIEYHSNIVKIVAEYFDPQYSTNVDLYLLTYVQQSNGTYQNSESEVFATCPSSYFGSAKPVLAYNNGQIVIVYRKNASEGLKERTKWYYPGNGTWVWSNENTIPQTDANSINPAVAELYGNIHIVFESLNEIKYKFGYIMSTSWRYDPLITISTGSGFNINRNPSISISGASTNYVVVSWTGVYTAALDKKLPKQNDYIDRYAAVVKVGYGSSWGGTSNFSNNVSITDNNSLNSSVGSIVAWSESNGLFSKYVKRQPNGLYDNIASLSANGKSPLVSNGSQFSNIKAMVFNTLTSAPYLLNNCNNDFSLQALSKENEQQQINLSYGRSGIIEKNSLEFLFSLGDVLLDDNVIKFIARVDTLPVNNLQELNNSARTESFSLNNQSQLIFSNSYYVVNANKADSLLEDDFSVNFKCQLVNASTEQVVGTFDEMIYNKNNALEYDNPGYLVDCPGIEAGQYYLRLLTSTNNDVNLFISDIQKENVVLEKSSLKVKNFKGEDIPLTYGLEQNYPNPFNPNTTIRYQLPQNGMVTLKVYDILGAEVATLVNEEKLAGKYEVNFNANALASGVYIYKLQAGSYTNSKKLVLIK